MLISVLVMMHNAEGRLGDNAQVEPETPVLDIPDVSADALFHLPVSDSCLSPDFFRRGHEGLQNQ